MCVSACVRLLRAFVFFFESECVYVCVCVFVCVCVCVSMCVSVNVYLCM